MSEKGRKRRFLFTYRFEWTMPEDAIEARDTDDAEEQAIDLIMDSLRDGGLGCDFQEVLGATEFVCDECGLVFEEGGDHQSMDGLCAGCADIVWTENEEES